MLIDRLKRLVATVARLPAPAGHGRARRSLVSRLLGLLVLGAGVVYLVVNAGLWWTSTRLIETSLERQAARWVAELDELGTPLFASRRSRHLTVIDDRIKHFPEIAYVRYYDAGGRKALGHYGPERDLDIPPPTDEQLARLRQMADAEEGEGETRRLTVPLRLEDNYLRVLAPIRIRSIAQDGMLNFSLKSTPAETVRVIGFLDFGIAAHHYRQEFVQNLINGGVAMALLFGFVLWIGRRLITRALNPLTELQEPLARLARGDTEVTVKSEGDAEIAAISDALNATINAIRRRDETLRDMAERDALTGLVNRASFTRELEQEIARCAAGASSAVFFVDLDQFKYVNDTLGHAAGDRLLVQVAQLLTSRMRDRDVVSRFGGDEFVILARDVDRAQAAEIAGSLNGLMRDMHVIEGEQVVNVYCSIGITVVDSGRYNVEDVLAQADMACYEAKTRGRNRYHAYEFSAEDRKKIVTDLAWAQQIKTALRGDGFRLVYQPIVRLQPGGEEYHEALLRLRTRDGDWLTPGAFLPVAQRFGLLAEIDRWVLANAIRALGEARRTGRALVFTVNLSGESFEDPGLPALVESHLRAHGVPGTALILEITEQTAVRHLERAGQLIGSLNALGCRLALDDFGKGFSSFSHLKHLPVNFIKIDGSFIEHLHRNPVDQAMVQSIIQVARALGKTTIAEFVQNEETLGLLRRSGVDFVQGYYLGEPGDLPPPHAEVA
jgi:diguanylate cyclase (GGDEF)-like protein